MNCFCQQWKVASAVLQILFKLLEGYTPKPEDFVNQFVEIQGGERILVPKPPGFSLMTYMLNDTPMLRMVSVFELCFKLNRLLECFKEWFCIRMQSVYKFSTFSVFISFCGLNVNVTLLKSGYSIPVKELHLCGT